MKYMVMECHLSYAVVLDEDGRFFNVANRHYEVGQTVENVIEMQDTQPVISAKPKTHYKWIGSIAAMAACLVLIVTAVFQFGASPYASVYMTINPEVRIDVNRQDIVVDIEGINEDGKALVEDYGYKKKGLDLVMDELVDRAIEMGFLHEGGQITLTLDADDNEWIVTKSGTLNTHLNEYLTDKLSVTIEITNNPPEITIPIDPDTDYGDSDYGETTSEPSTETTTPSTGNGTDYEDTDYDDSDYEDSRNDGDTDYGDTDYDEDQTDYDSDSEDSDYDDTDYGPNNDGVTDYDDTDYGPNSDGVTDYDDTDYGPNNDGVTDYDDTDYEDQSDQSDYDDNGNSDYDDDDGDSDYDD